MLDIILLYEPSQVSTSFCVRSLKWRLLLNNKYQTINKYKIGTSVRQRKWKYLKYYVVYCNYRKFYIINTNIEYLHNMYACINAWPISKTQFISLIVDTEEEFLIIIYQCRAVSSRSRRDHIFYFVDRYNSARQTNYIN